MYIEASSSSTSACFEVVEFQGFQHLVGGSEGVAISDGGGGVDAVDHHIGAAVAKQPVEQETLEGVVFERSELGTDRLASRHRAVETEQVAVRQREHGIAGFLQQLLPGALGLLEAQAVDLDLAGMTLQELTAHRGADQSITAEDEDLLAFDLQSCALLRSPLRTSFDLGRGRGTLRKPGIRWVCLDRRRSNGTYRSGTLPIRSDIGRRSRYSIWVEGRCQPERSAAESARIDAGGQ